MKVKLIAICLVALFSFTSANDLIKFYDTTSGSWNDMKSLAVKEQKLIFIDAYTDWCVWCKVMDRETFSDKAVADFMNEKFINVRYEMETGFGALMSGKYRVNGFPTFLIFTANGRLVNRIVGYHKVKEFLEKLNIALDSTKHDNLAGVTNEIEAGFPEFYKLSFLKGELRKRPDSATVNNFLSTSTDLLNEVSWSIMYRFSGLLEPKYKQFIFDNSDKIKTLFGKYDMESVTGQLVSGELRSAIAKNDSLALLSVIEKAKKYSSQPIVDIERNYQIQFYQGTKQWIRFAEIIELNKSLFDENAFNSYSWTIYERCDDKKVVAQAVKWMSDVVMKSPKYMFLDTYAALLYKNSDLKNARKYAEKAIAAGKKENEKVEETEALLKKIKAESIKKKTKG
ncbi:MAG: DUF255 domain-containing protein [Bacteroidota bacterium]|nr:DUF255 domain-containing protein [Bacteroidota bacterium]